MPQVESTQRKKKRLSCRQVIFIAVAFVIGEVLVASKINTNRWWEGTQDASDPLFGNTKTNDSNNFGNITRFQLRDTSIRRWGCGLTDTPLIFGKALHMSKETNVFLAHLTHAFFQSILEKQEEELYEQGWLLLASTFRTTSLGMTIIKHIIQCVLAETKECNKHVSVMANTTTIDHEYEKKILNQPFNATPRHRWEWQFRVPSYFMRGYKKIKATIHVPTIPRPRRLMLFT
jgi:hypothetical protein